MRLGWGCVLLVGCGFAVSTSDLGDLSVGDLGEPDLAVLKQPGEPCGPGDSCAPGSGCADGVCCDDPSCAGCNACNSAGKCVPVTAGSDPHHFACAPSKACFTQCRWDADCVLGTYCDSGACVASGFQDAACARNAQCINGLVCVNGTCGQCATSGDCGAQPTQICDPASHLCMGCVGASQCAASGWGNSCSGSCHCDTIGPAQCGAAAAPFCDGSICVCGSGPVPCHPQEICSSNDVNGVCKVRTGEPCLADGDCNSGHCANGVCS